jgi:Tfp pilus assembly protein PilX
VIYAPFSATNTIAANPTPGSYTLGSYAKIPEYYIYDLGANAGSTPGEVYQIDAVGYGGTANTVAVVESTYLITTSTATNGNGL